MSKQGSKRSPVNDRVEIRDLKAWQWYKLRNPARILLTYFLFLFVKYLTPAMKRPIYRLFGVEIGENTALAPGVVVDPFYPEKITIGSDAIVGWGTKVLTHESYPGEWHVGPVEIGDNVTVGHSSSLRPGITIGNNAEVGAHSFVNRDVEAGEKVGGVPIRSL